MITCRTCELRQPAGNKCVRCGEWRYPFMRPDPPEETPAAPPPVAAPRRTVEPVITLAEMEKRAIQNALKQLGLLEAAMALGIGKTTIYRLMRQYGIPNPGPRLGSRGPYKKRAA